MEIFTLVLLFAIVFIGLYKNMLWLAVIGGFLLFAYMYGARNEKAVPTGGAGKPKIRPIIVRRRYEGPPSIYPSLMKIRVNPMWNTKNWFENAFAAVAMGTIGMINLMRRNR
ncbi:MAG: hypothetical protein J7K68_00250 [Candidatus Diapherotrites archaeon]|nr:hypothetical protein [Candidatus Diapherotrites archaeon]